MEGGTFLKLLIALCFKGCVVAREPEAVTDDHLIVYLKEDFDMVTSITTISRDTTSGGVLSSPFRARDGRTAGHTIS